MKPPILNIADIELMPRPPSFAPKGKAVEKYEAKMAPIGGKIGARKLGYNVTAVPPGKCAFPFHNHQVNEEMFYVLAGNGEIRIGENKFAIKTGDIIACPAGGPDMAHQIINTGKAELRYLAVSTKLSPEIAEYPDTGRFGVLGELAPKKDGSPRIMMFIGDETKSLDYWDGE